LPLVVQYGAVTFPDFVHAFPDTKDIIGPNTDGVEQALDLAYHKVSLVVVASEPVIGVMAGLSKTGRARRLARHKDRRKKHSEGPQHFFRQALQNLAHWLQYHGRRRPHVEGDQHFALVIEVIKQALENPQRVRRVLNSANQINKIRSEYDLRRVALDRFDPRIACESLSLILGRRLRQLDRNDLLGLGEPAQCPDMPAIAGTDIRHHLAVVMIVPKPHVPEQPVVGRAHTVGDRPLGPFPAEGFDGFLRLGVCLIHESFPNRYSYKNR
jgi:hypothetical protein